MSNCDQQIKGSREEGRENMVATGHGVDLGSWSVSPHRWESHTCTIRGETIFSQNVPKDGGQL